MEIYSAPPSYSFWKNIVLIVLFFTITPITLGVSLLSLVSLKEPAKPAQTTQENKTLKSGVRVYASLPSGYPTVSGEANPSDARVEIVRQYLEFYNSPLEPASSLIVNAADRYGLDYRLTTAIAQKESNLCKLIPEGSFNCWGWGVHSEGTLGFSSFEEGVETVSKGLKEDYIDKDFITVGEIMGKYTPLSNGSWADGVNQFMSEMQ